MARKDFVARFFFFQIRNDGNVKFEAQTNRKKEKNFDRHQQIMRHKMRRDNEEQRRSHGTDEKPSGKRNGNRTTDFEKENK